MGAHTSRQATHSQKDQEYTGRSLLSILQTDPLRVNDKRFARSYFVDQAKVRILCEASEYV